MEIPKDVIFSSNTYIYIYVCVYIYIYIYIYAVVIIKKCSWNLNYAEHCLDLIKFDAVI